MMNMSDEEMERIYLDMIEPHKLIQHFPTDQEFTEWLGIGDKDDLGWTLKAFEEAELFNHCILIKKEIDNRG